MADNQYKLEEFEDSLKNFQQAIEIEPTNTKALKGHVKTSNSIGYKYLKLKNVDKSSSFFDEVLKIETNNLKALTGLGLGLNIENEFKKSLD